MAGTFLSAAWRYLVMANYAVDPFILRPHVPFGTELDEFKGTCYVSLVGFLFKDTKLLGLSVPFHRTFEEVNLRFYVRYKENGIWKRGVVFLKEIVPKRMISLVANAVYGEQYVTSPMKHVWKNTGKDLLVEYYWKSGGKWNHLKALADPNPCPIEPGSEEEFITEHYWGYTFVDETSSGAYEVRHPKWRVHPVHSYDIRCSVAALYGEAFVAPLNEAPRSVFLAEGSAIEVRKKTKIRVGRP